MGWIPVTITPDMVGTRVAIFIGWEQKTSGTATTKEQKAFIDRLTLDGGHGYVVQQDDIEPTFRRIIGSEDL